MSRRRPRDTRPHISEKAACRGSNSGLIRQQWALLNVSMPLGGRPAYYYSLTDKRQGNYSIRLVPLCGDTSQMISPGQPAIPHRFGRGNYSIRLFWRRGWNFKDRPLCDIWCFIQVVQDSPCRAAHIFTNHMTPKIIGMASKCQFDHIFGLFCSPCITFKVSIEEFLKPVFKVRIQELCKALKVCVAFIICTHERNYTITMRRIGLMIERIVVILKFIILLLLASKAKSRPG